MALMYRYVYGVCLTLYADVKHTVGGTCSTMGLGNTLLKHARV